MNAYEAYCRYVATKIHFTSESYDYFKFKAKTRTSVQSFNSRKDKFFFERIVKKYTDSEIEEIFFSNFVTNTNFWIGSAFDADNSYTDWKKTTNSMQKRFTDDIKYLHEKNNDLNKLLNCKNDLCPLFWCAVHKDISIETYLILDSIFNFSKKLSKKYADNYIFKTFNFKCEKYKEFFFRTIDLQNKKNIYIDILKSKFMNSADTKI